MRAAVVRAIDLRTANVLEREERLKSIIAMLCEAVEARRDPLFSKDEVEANFVYVIAQARRVLA